MLAMPKFSANGSAGVEPGSTPAKRSVAGSAGFSSLEATSAEGASAWKRRMGRVVEEVRSTHFQSSPQLEMELLGTWKRMGAKVSVKTKLATTVSPASTCTPLRITGRRVGELTFSEYHPGIRWAMVKRPCASVIMCSTTSLEASVAKARGPTSTTVAPIRGMPLLSETTPAKLPYPPARAGEGCRQESIIPPAKNTALSRNPEAEVIVSATDFF